MSLSDEVRYDVEPAVASRETFFGSLALVGGPLGFQRVARKFSMRALVSLLLAGAKLRSVQAYGARDPRRVPPPDDPLVGAHIDDLLAAEGLVAAFSAVHGTAQEPELDTGQIEQIRTRITKLNEQWQATGPGEVLRLHWPSDTTTA